MGFTMDTLGNREHLPEVLGLGVRMGVVLVGGGTQMPAVRDLVWEVFGREPPAGEGVDPSEAVALGAALGAAVIEGTVQRTEAVLLDETPDVEDLNVLANKLLELLGDELPDEA